MKILQLTNKPPYPPRDGGSLAMFGMAKALKSLGHEIVVLTMFTDKHRLKLEQHKEFSKIMEVHTVYVNTIVNHTGMLMNLLFSKKPYTATRFYSRVYANELAKLLQSRHFDFVQLEGLYLTPYIPVIRKYSDSKIVLRAHNIEHEIWERIAHEEKVYYRKRYFSIVAQRVMDFEYKALNTYDLLVPITERDLLKFKSMGNLKPAHVSPAGVDINPECSRDEVPSMPGTGFSLFYLGSLDWIPNQEGLVWFTTHVFPKLRRKYHDLRLHVAGRNAPMLLISKIVQPGVVYHGEINDPDRFTREHTALIAPCFSGSGMRLKIIEAMALAKPVITTTMGAEGLSAVNGKHLFIADDPDNFSQVTEMLINDRDLCISTGKEAWKFVCEHYNNRDIAVSLAAFYNNYMK
ncbi:MAG TPA: glycosyltransferase family 4 protein [Bacteroidales bacterium]|nr:glycosyltransferase family 4 protein [Bacteroidales bacterium]